MLIDLSCVALRICWAYISVVFVSAKAIASYSYNSILQFGGCRDDFMLTISRITSSVDEPRKERQIFAMPKEEILELTLLIKDYIKVRRLLSAPLGVARSNATANPRRSPRKTIGTNKKSEK